ncbi:unnamed protein product [Parajaminaea phylloscopi]
MSLGRRRDLSASRADQRDPGCVGPREMQSPASCFISESRRRERRVSESSSARPPARTRCWLLLRTFSSFGIHSERKKCSPSASADDATGGQFCRRQTEGPQGASVTQCSFPFVQVSVCRSLFRSSLHRLAGPAAHTSAKPWSKLLSRSS